jgi:hypothetical protein
VSERVVDSNITSSRSEHKELDGWDLDNVFDFQPNDKFDKPLTMS